MKPLIRAAALAALLSPFAFAANEAAAPEIRSSPQAIGAMAEAVTAFFSPGNMNPAPAKLNGVVNLLQTVGRRNGPTRAEVQPVLDRIALAADEFSPIEPSEQEPAPGLAPAVKLELLAGPLRAWLAEGQKDSILKKQAEYGAKLTRQDRERLSAKMKAWADALSLDRRGEGLAAGGAAAPVDARGPGASTPVKADLWRDHGHLTEHIAQVGRAPDVVDRPGRFAPLQPAQPVSPGPAASAGTIAVLIGSLVSLPWAKMRKAPKDGSVAPRYRAAAFGGLFSAVYWPVAGGAFHALTHSHPLLGYALGAYAGYVALIALISLGRFIDSFRPREGEMGAVEAFFQSRFFFGGLPVAGALAIWFAGLGGYANPVGAFFTALIAVPVALIGAYLASIFTVIAMSSFDRGA